MAICCVALWVCGEFTHDCEFDYDKCDYTKKHKSLTIGFYKCKHERCKRVDCAVIGDDNCKEFDFIAPRIAEWIKNKEKK